MRERLATLAYSFGWSVVKALPEKIAYQLFRIIADFAYRRGGKSVDRLRNNLARVSPGLTAFELESLTQQAMRSYLRYWCDAFRLPVWSRERTLSTVTVHGQQFLDEAMSQGGCVVSLPHSGNWDHAGVWAMMRGYHLVTVAEQLKPEAVFQKFLDYRTSLGMEVHALGKDPRLVAHLAESLRQGHLVALVADRDLSANGVEVKFFGGKAKMPAGPAALSIQTGAALIPAHVRYNSGGIVVTFYPPVTSSLEGRTERIADLTQKAADSFSQGIAEHPADWHMLQRIWIDS